MLRTRIISAAVFVPLFLGLLIAGAWFYALAVLIILVVSTLEYISVLRRANYHVYDALLLGSVILCLAAQVFGLMPVALGPGLAGLLILAATSMVAGYGRGDSHPVVDFGLSIGGVVYIGWLGAHLIAIRQLPNGVYWALMAVVATGFCDVGAFFVGRAWGHHKMAPVVSPNKTWEGYWGGVLTAVLVGALIAAAAQVPIIRIEYGALIGLVTGITSPIGDLAMSVIKRSMGVKDFSHILPGHGGMLDRIDSLLVGVAIAYYIIIWIIAL